MKSKSSKPRSIHIKMSVRTFNDLEIVLSELAEKGTRKDRQKAALLRRRLDRAPRLHAK